MLATINIFGFEVATYGILVFIGIAVGIVFVLKYFAKFHDIKKEDLLFSILYGVIGLGVGAKLLYIITYIPFLVENYQTLNLMETLVQLFKGGFVFYGGLIGAILGIFVYSKQFKVSFKTLLLTIVPAVPLVHAIGRIGCFLAGCCYGMEYHGFGSVVFTNSVFAPNNIELFPVQIVECIANLIIFIILIITYKKYLGTYKTIGLYCILYSIVRFILEFFRGDIIRGFILELSTSQWISILLFILGIGIFIYENKKEKKQ